MAKQFAQQRRGVAGILGASFVASFFSFLCSVGIEMIPPAPGFIAPLSARRPSARDKPSSRRAAATAVVVEYDGNLAYNMWRDEYPKAAENGNFLGIPTSHDDMEGRFAALCEGLHIGWEEAMKLVETDSMVLFAGTTAEQINEKLLQIEIEVGSLKTAFEVVQKQPTFLLSPVAELRGKGPFLLNFADFADRFRPIYRMFRKASVITTAQIFPQPPNWRAMGLPEAGWLMKLLNEKALK